MNAENLLNQICIFLLCSEITPEGRRITKLDQILLNGNNIAIVSIRSGFQLYFCMGKLRNLTKRVTGQIG